jgi:hypothetical protein
VTSLAEDLCVSTRDALVDRYDLAEVEHLPLPSGTLRRYAGGPIDELVYIGLTVPPIGLDSHMLFAFTRSTSLVPHFTVDSVRTGEAYAFHLDLIPRVELGPNLAYMDEVYGPLSDVATETRQIEGLTPAHLSMRQYALMSPWMLVHRADEAAFAKVPAAVAAYCGRFCELLDGGVTAEVDLGDEARAARDVRHRSTLFSSEVDPVWGQVERLVGAELSARLQATLRGTP